MDTAEESAPLSAPQMLDEVDSFIANFSIVDDELSAPDGETREIALEPEDENEPLTLIEEDVPDEPIELVLEEEPADETPPAETVRRPRVFLLLLFILFAVPLTLAAALILLIPTLLSLVLSAACIVAGCAGIVAAFSGFPVFADILIVLGCAIVALALGLLFLWLFIWFVGAVIGGLIRWVVQLGSQWCYKEVAA